MIRVNEQEYELLQQAKDALKKRGFDGANLPDEEVRKSDWGNFALGAVVGISAYVLLRELLKK